MFDHILVPMDGSPLAECVLPHVVALSNAFTAQTTLLQVLGQPETGGQFVDPLSWQMKKVEAQNYLEGIYQKLRDVNIQSDYQLVDGQAANSIIDFAHNNQVNLIVRSSNAPACPR
jgi:nucleotide-binding universal stress UspA family protein